MNLQAIKIPIYILVVLCIDVICKICVKILLNAQRVKRKKNSKNKKITILKLFKERKRQFLKNIFCDLLNHFFLKFPLNR